MKLNNTILSYVLGVLGLFLTLVSFKLSSAIQKSSKCVQQNKLANANRGILVVGIVLFMSSVGYILCKRNCSSESSPESTSELMYLSFNLVLGIVIIVLFSIVSSELKKCGAVLSKSDSALVTFGILIGVASTVLSIGFLGKKLYDNRKELPGQLSQMKTDASARLTQMKNNAPGQLAQMKTDASAKLAQMKTDASAKLAQMKNNAPGQLAQMKNDASAKLSQMKNDASAKLAQMKNNSVTSSPERNGNNPVRYVDPFGMDIGHNGNNPVRYVDPFGLDEGDSDN